MRGRSETSGVTGSIDVAVPVSTAYNQWVVEIGGVRREFDAKITEQHPDERVARTSTSGPRHAGVVTFHRLDENHTRVTAQMEDEPEGLVEEAGDKLGVLRRRVKGDLERFKEFIEKRGVETGAWRGDVRRPTP